MPEIDLFKRSTGCFELGFVERETTPRWAMKLGIRLHLARLSLSNTVSELDRFGVDRCRSTIHNWVQKTGLQPTEGESPDHVAVDETVIQIDDQRYWLYAAVNPYTNEFLQVKLGTAQNLDLSEIFLGELREKHDVFDAVFLVDGAQWLQEACHHHGLRFQHVTHGNRNVVERLYKELKRRTDQFASHFRNVQTATVETWLLAQVFCQNLLI
jgi:transposase-like protein